MNNTMIGGNMRSQQNLLPGPIDGYKIFNEDMTCSPNKNTFQFQMGRNKLPNSNALELCKNGFHFCPQPSGVWAYYSTGKVFKVRAYDVLDTPFEPGADFKMVCAEIEILEEVKFGDRNTGDGNTGYRNTGYRNTGDGNTGDRNTGDGNTGYRNTGDRNTGYGNTGDFHSGSLNYGEAPIYLFNKITKVKRDDIPWNLVYRLSDLLISDEPIDPTPFLSIPNATEKAIKKLHESHIAARKAKP